MSTGAREQSPTPTADTQHPVDRAMAAWGELGEWVTAATQAVETVDCSAVPEVVIAQCGTAIETVVGVLLQATRTNMALRDHCEELRPAGESVYQVARAAPERLHTIATALEFLHLMLTTAHHDRAVPKDTGT